jgi:hypothetical protein
LWAGVAVVYTSTFVSNGYTGSAEVRAFFKPAFPSTNVPLYTVKVISDTFQKEYHHILDHLPQIPRNHDYVEGSYLLVFDIDVQPIARYAPEGLSKLIMTYLYYVVPFREMLDPHNFANNPYLFAKAGSSDAHWFVSDQTDAMEKLSKTFSHF